MRVSAPKILLHLEGLAVFATACVVYHGLGGSWLQFAVLFLAPDLAMIGYALGTRIGAVAYNVTHTYITVGLLCLAGYLWRLPGTLPVGAIWVAHIGFDRLLGYGLKYSDAFKDTHLGRV